MENGELAGHRQRPPGGTTVVILSSSVAPVIWAGPPRWNTSRWSGTALADASKGSSCCSDRNRDVQPSAALEVWTGLLEPRNSRSEEHTSELQSLMRISYAVFCLKKKKHI